MGSFYLFKCYSRLFIVRSDNIWIFFFFLKIDKNFMNKIKDNHCNHKKTGATLTFSNS